MAEFKEVMRQFDRMCSVSEGNCEKCQITELTECIDCTEYVINNPARAEEIIMAWAAEHPEPTLQDVLFEKFPNALLEADGSPQTCAALLGLCTDCPEERNCKECWSRPAPEE